MDKYVVYRCEKCLNENKYKKYLLNYLKEKYENVTWISGRDVNINKDVNLDIKYIYYNLKLNKISYGTSDIIFNGYYRNYKTINIDDLIKINILNEII